MTFPPKGPGQAPSSPVAPLGGVSVVTQPTVSIASSIHSAVAKTLGDLPPDAKGAIVGVATAKGVNIAVAYKLEKGWDVAAWIGKSGWEAPIEGGVVIQKIIR